jgi:CDP-diacylglycerol--glycerol-3-phosphate 3-phosphatidyltransferase
VATDGCHPAVSLLALGVIVYFSVRNWLWILSMPLPEGTGSGGYLGVRARLWYRELMRPLEEAFVAAAIGPNAITYSQVALAAAAGFAFARGAMFLGGWLVIAAGTLDVLDGAVARRTEQNSPRGAFIDSIVDRYAELLTHAGLAYYFRGTWLAVVVWLNLFGSLMVSYTRARGEGLGVDCRVGGAQRPERVVLLGFGAFLSDIAAHLSCAWTGTFSHGILGFTVVTMAVLANVTAVQRARWVSRRLDGMR